MKGLMNELLDGLSDPLAVLDNRGNILKTNSAFQALWYGQLAGVPRGGLLDDRYVDQISALAGSEWEVSTLMAGIKDVAEGRRRLYDQELLLGQGDNERTFWIRVKMLEGDNPQVLVSHTDISHLKQKNAMPSANSAPSMLDEVVENVPAAIFCLKIQANGQSQVQFLSPGVYNLYQQPEGESTAFLFQAILPEFRESLENVLRDAYMNKGEVELEFQIKTPDKSIRWVKMKATALANGPGSVLLHGIAADISETKKMLAFFEEISTISATGGWEVDAQTDELFWTKASFKLYELPDDFAIDNQVAYRFYHPDTLDELVAAYRKMVAEGTPFDVKVKIITARGRERWLRIAGQAEYAGGKPRRYFGISQDITDLKHAGDHLETALSKEQELNEKLAASEGELLAALEEKTGLSAFLDDTSRMARIGGWTMDGETQTMNWTEEMYRLFEVPSGTPVSRELASRYYPKDMKPIVDDAFKDLLTTQAPFDLEHELITKSGRVIWVRSMGRPEVRDGKVTRYLGTIQDITDRKTAESALSNALEKEQLLNEELAANERQLTSYLAEKTQLVEELETQEARYRLLANNSGDLVALHDPEGEYRWVSPSLMRIAGFTSDELLNTSLFDFVHPSDVEKLKEEVFLPAKMGNKQKGLIQYRFRHKRGFYIWLETIVQPIYDESNQLVNLQTTSRDVTERRMAEEELRDSEARYRSLIDSLNSGVTIFETRDGGKHFHYTTFNKAAEDFERLDRNNVLGREIREIFPSIENYGFVSVMQKVYETGEAIHFPPTLYEDDRIRGWRKCYVYKMPTGEVVSVYDDVTAIVESQRKIEEQNRRLTDFRNALDASAMVVFTDADGLINYVNENFEKHSGFTSDEVVGKIIHSVQEGYMQRENYKAMLHQVLKGTIWRGEVQNMTKDGTPYWLDSTIVPFMDGEGRAYQFMTVSSDITDRKKAETNLQVINEELIQKNNSLQQFAYVTSHNLRAPIARIIGLTNIYNKKVPDDPFNLEVIGMLETSGMQLDEVIQDLVKVTDVQHVHDELNEHVSLQHLLDSVMLTLEAQLKRINGTIAIDIEAVPTLYSVKSYLNSILFNLLSNAIKYHSKHRLLKIKVSTHQLEGSIQVRVEDNGLGIDLAQHGKNLFGFYKRFHYHIEGKGLGLYLVKNQVEALGGTISVDSTVDKGTTFLIEFPTKEQAGDSLPKA